MEASANWSAADSPLIKKRLLEQQASMEWKRGGELYSRSIPVGGNRRWEPRDVGV